MKEDCPKPWSDQKKATKEKSSGVQAIRQSIDVEKSEGMKAKLLLPQVLDTVSYVWNDNGAQIVFLILNPVEDSEDNDEVRKMVELGKHLNTMNAAFSAHGKRERKNLTYKVVPHKYKTLAGRSIKECHSLRYAQVLVTKKDDEAEERLSYTFMGGGVPWQAPGTYAMVTKEMPVA